MVKLTVRAERDLEAIYAYIPRGRPEEEAEGARRWYLGLREAIRSPDSLPLRGPRVAGSPKHRHLLYGGLPHVYRIIYRVEGPMAQVVHIRRGARKGAGLR